MEQKPILTLINTTALTGCPLEQRTDDELMELSMANLHHAFAEIIRRYQKRVRSFCLKWDRAQGEDLAQECFIKLWNKRNAYQPRGQFPVFLFTIVRHCCINAKRNWVRRNVHNQALPIPGDSSNPSQLDQLLEQERLQKIHGSIAELPSKLKESLLLRMGEGFSYSHIAEIIGVPEATARSRVFLGFQHLREKLNG